MSSDDNTQYRRPVRKRNTQLILPPEVNSIADLIAMAQTGMQYENIDTEMLWKISAQLIEINDMIGMEKLKQSIFYHIIYYLQDLYIDDEKDYLHTVIMGPPGCGKCLAEDTLVLMYDGEIKKVQDIQTGDILMGDDSTPRNVLSTCSGIDDLYQVCQPNGSYYVNKSHILSLRHNDKTIDIPIEQYLDAHDKDSYLGFKTAIHFEKSVQLTIDPYILGFSIVSRIEFPHEDIFLIEIDNNKKLVKDYIIQFNILEKIAMDTYSISFDYLKEYTDCFTQNVLPQDFIFFSHTTLKWILTGIIDGIGEVAGDKVNLYLEPARFVKDIVRLCDIIGVEYILNTYSYNVDMGHSTSKIHTYHLVLKNVLNFIQSKVHTSADKNLPLIVSYPISVVPYKKDTYYGFELDGNGRFLLHDCTVTHNTTIAKIIGEMYKNMGILSPDGVFRIAKREDLVAEYLGQTAVKTKKLLDSCIGGVLFIDEVYALGPGKKDTDSFSKEAIDTLNVFLSENSSSFCCIIAGYEQDIKHCFFSVNQGLERRFQWVHRIEDYNTEQLGEMFIKILADIRWRKDKDLTKDQIVNLIKSNEKMFKSFGGDIENLITKCKMAHAKRIINVKNPEKHVITIKDLELAIELMKPNSLKEEVKEDDRYLWSMYN